MMVSRGVSRDGTRRAVHDAGVVMAESSGGNGDPAPERVAAGRARDRGERSPSRRPDQSRRLPWPAPYQCGRFALPTGRD